MADINKTVREIIEEVQSDICDNFCRYRKTCDNEANCEYIRQGNDCPLDRLGY